MVPSDLLAAALGGGGVAMAVALPTSCPRVPTGDRESPIPSPRTTHPAVVVVVHGVQVALQELRLRGDQHVTGQAVRSLDLLEEVLLADACAGGRAAVHQSLPLLPTAAQALTACARCRKPGA